MKNLFCLLFGMLLAFTGFTQPCLPQGITFTTQTQVDNFKINHPGCTQIGGEVKISGLGIITGGITDLTGLNGLITIGGNLTIESNTGLVNLSGLDALGSVGGDFSISNNTALTSLTGLGALTSIGGNLHIWYNLSLAGLSDLNSLDSIGGGLHINGSAMTNLVGLNFLTSIGGGFSLEENSFLQSFTGLYSLVSIGGNFDIFDNLILTNFTGLETLATIGGSLRMDGTSLVSLTGLNGVTTIGGTLYITNNYSLTTLVGIENIHPATITGLSISANSSLSTCDVKSICGYLANPGGMVYISGNASGCRDTSEVETACGLNGVEDFSENDVFSICPNPASDQITIATSAPPVKCELSVTDLRGQELIRRQISASKTQLDLSNLAGGVYFVRLTSERKAEVRKLIKQ